MTQTDFKQRRQFWLGIIISLASLLLIFIFINPVKIIEALRTAQYGYLGLSAVGILTFMVLRTVRWRFMLNNEVSWLQLFHIQNIGYMLTNILPFRIGDVARAVLIGNVPPVTLAQGISTMVVERLLDMMFIVTLLPFTLSGVETLPPWMQSAASASRVLAVSAIIILIVAANQRPLARNIATRLLRPLSPAHTEKWVKRIDDLLIGLNSLTRFKDGFILIILSIATWLPIIFSYYNTMRAVNIEPTIAMAGFVVCAAAFSIAAPSSPGQIGVFHLGVTLALQAMGQPETASASFAFLYHALNLITMVILGVLGIYGTGATFANVVAATQAFIKREQ